mmetsp:Transcript_3407/g.4698  ORF Transcript_3407/g.4698 Transcript_3407/m.4698 type:complete len:252 (+) Transcript_3407:143-898(+)
MARPSSDLERASVEMCLNFSEPHPCCHTTSEQEVHDIGSLSSDMVRLLGLHELLHLLQQLLLEQVRVPEEPGRVGAFRCRPLALLQQTLQLLQALFLAPAGAGHEVAEGGRLARLQHGEPQGVPVAVQPHLQQPLLVSAGLPLPPEGAPGPGPVHAPPLHQGHPDALLVRVHQAQTHPVLIADHGGEHSVGPVRLDAAHPGLHQVQLAGRLQRTGQHRPIHLICRDFGRDDGMDRIGQGGDMNNVIKGGCW